MINRRSFLLTLAVQPLLIQCFITSKVFNQETNTETQSDTTEFVIINGWTFLITDLFDSEG